MAPLPSRLPSRETLETYKRLDLQKLCKDYGVKANLKSEALIDLLLDTVKPASRSAPTRRSISARHPSRSGPSRISSIIIHDTDEESNEGEGKEGENKISTDVHQSDAQPNSQPKPTPPLATRTRKGKEQTRLGVGRPMVAGGAGPRAVTKSLSVSKGRQGKASGSMRPTEATILEEVEIEEPNLTRGNGANPEQVPSQKTPLASIEHLAEIDKRVADALRPLHEHMKSMKLELELMQSLKMEVKELKAQVDQSKVLEQKVETLTAAVTDFGKEMEGLASLRAEIVQLRGSINTLSRPSTPKLQDLSLKKRGEPSGLGLPSSLPETTLFQGLSSSQHASSAPRSHPGITQSMLGKRHREPSMTGDTEDLPADRSLVKDSSEETRPLAKRTKLSEEDRPVEEQGPGGIVAQDTQEEEHVDTARATFTVFEGLGESVTAFMEPPSPTNNLPDLFPPPSPGMVTSTRQLTTSTAHAAENHQPFTFAFHPMSSTPAHGMFMPSFPYPEPPQSPSPAGTNTTAFSNQTQQGRSDVFQTFGFPPPGRPRAVPRGSGSGFINPAALTPADRDQTDLAAECETQSNAEAVGRDKDDSITGMAADVSETKRTMYGTELEGDTRFGDFGVEGVGRNVKGGFWAGGRY